MIKDKKLENFLNNPDYDVLTDRLFQDMMEQFTTYNNMTAERVYPTSNEFLTEVFTRFNMVGKRVATVGSSGDQMLSALLQGSNDIVIIDANPYTRAFVEYKMAAIASLEYKDFVGVMGTPEFLSWETYAKISHCLSNDVRQFWDTLMIEQEQTNDEKEVFDTFRLSRNLTHSYPFFKSCKFYNDEDEYLKLQNILRVGKFNLDFINADLFDFPEKLDGTFDYIFLSNIYDYNRIGYEGEQFEKTIQRLYDDKLNPGGTMQVAYMHRLFWYDMDSTVFAGRKAKIVELGDKVDDHTVMFIDKPTEDVHHK